MHYMKALLTLYHFNIQFIAGDEATYHLNVVEGFEPLLDLYLKNPEWKADLELQGHFLEFCEKEYPHVIEKLKKLCERGQIELISVHYSDQIYLAYPKEDMELSEKINSEILSKYGLRRSKVFFAQENFFGPRVPKYMKNHGYEIALIDRSYYEYFRDLPEIAPYYKYDEVYVVLGRGEGFKYNNVEWSWLWYGDGEPVLTGRSPYSLFDYRTRDEFIERLRDKIRSYRDRGYQLMTVGDFVERLKSLDITPSALPQVPEGAWNMKDCRGVYQWMGFYASPYEMDVEIRSLTFKSRKYVLGALSFIKWAKEKGYNVSEEERILNKAIKHQLLAEVSDSTGWSPTFVEVGYSIKEAHLAIFYSLRVIDSLKKKCNITEKIVIDTKNNTIMPFKGHQKEMKEAGLPITIDFVGDDISTKCYKLNKGVYLVRAELKPKEGIAGFKVPLRVDYVIYSPSLADDEVVVLNLDEYSCEKFYLPLPNGLLGIDKETFIVKNNETMHLAVTIDKPRRFVGFLTEGVPSYKQFKWEFYVIKGSAEQALNKALEINVYPKLVV